MGNGEYCTLLTGEYRRTVKTSTLRNICPRERQTSSTSFHLVHFRVGTANPFLSSQLIRHTTIKWKRSQNPFSIIRQYLSRYIFITDGRIGFLPIQVRTTSGDGKYICRTLNTHVALNCPFLYPAQPQLLYACALYPLFCSTTSGKMGCSKKYLYLGRDFEAAEIQDLRVSLPPDIVACK